MRCYSHKIKELLIFILNDFKKIITNKFRFINIILNKNIKNNNTQPLLILTYILKKISCYFKIKTFPNSSFHDFNMFKNLILF